MILSIPILDQKLASHSVTSAIKTLAESEGARSGPRAPRKATNFGFLPDPNNRNEQWHQIDSSPFHRAQARSKRSWSITLVHAATKSFTNFSFESAHA